MLKTFVVMGCFVLTACTWAPSSRPPPPQPEIKLAPPRLALVLGGGAARGFAHVGVIKILELQGIHPDIVVGTSAGSVVGALYAAGYSGFDLQQLAIQLDEASMGDWTLPDRGIIRGESLQNFVNRAVQNRPLEKLNKRFAAVATDLQTGDKVVFQRGNTGMAVRASSSVPGLFQPVSINGHEYVDGGLTSPVPVRAAKSLGADMVIAVDISSSPSRARIKDSVDIMLQTFAIMGQAINSFEVGEADVVIRPETGTIKGGDFDARHLAILEGERAATAALPAIRAQLAKLARRDRETKK
jgi:NTE family protein